MIPSWESSLRMFKCALLLKEWVRMDRLTGRKVTFTERPLQARGCPCRLHANEERAHRAAL